MKLKLKGGGYMRTKLKVLRVKQGWTQKDVADKIGITAPNYNLIETGKRFGRASTWSKIKELYHLKDSEMYSIQNEK